MERARQEIANGLGLERWTVFGSSEVCDGCLFLAKRVFFAVEGPRPPLHPNCRCSRLPVAIAGMSGVQLIRLVLEARANGRATRFLMEEDRRRSAEDRIDRILEELAERDPVFRHLREERARR
jgi:hypothetical protein